MGQIELFNHLLKHLTEHKQMISIKLIISIYLWIALSRSYIVNK